MSKVTIRSKACLVSERHSCMEYKHGFTILEACGSEEKEETMAHLFPEETTIKDTLSEYMYHMFGRLTCPFFGKDCLLCT